MAVRDYFPIVRDRWRHRRFESLFLFVTSRCNSLCRTCFYFDKLNSRDDLSFDEIARISATAPEFAKLWISGGEPFLRDELGEIVEMFVRQNGVRSLNLPTNGLLAAKIFRTVDYLLEHCPGLTIDLNFSLDGLSNTHDASRGVPHNFEKSMDAIAQAEARYRGVRRLRRNVVTVITRENYRELLDLAQRLQSSAGGAALVASSRIDGQYFEVMRGVAPDSSLKAVPPDELRRLHRALMPLYRRYAQKLFGHLSAIPRRFATMYYLGNIRFHFELHEQCLEGPHPWPMACTAGRTSLVVDHNGAFRACELRGVVGRLQDYDFDAGRALASPAMRAETAAIPGAGCWCTHSCFIHDSSKFSPRVQLFHIPWLYVRQLFENGAVQDLTPYHVAELPG